MVSIEIGYLFTRHEPPRTDRLMHAGVSTERPVGHYAFELEGCPSHRELMDTSTML